MKAEARRGSIHGALARILLITGGRDGEGGRRRMQGALVGASTGRRGGGSAAGGVGAEPLAALQPGKSVA